MAHVFINGFKIVQNVGINTTNTINYLTGELTTGKTHHKSLPNKSEEITFSTVLSLDQLDDSYKVKNSKDEDVIRSLHAAYKEVAAVAKSKPVPILIIDDISKQRLSFMGRVTKFEVDMPVEFMYTYEWGVTEDANFQPSIKEFKTFNYKAPVVTPKPATPAASTAPAWIKALVKCTVGHDCKKYKVKCVYYVQDLLRKDGYYLKYKRDGWWCTYTTQEYRKWQKAKKLKVTGKFDTQTKNYIKKRWKI